MWATTTAYDVWINLGTADQANWVRRSQVNRVKQVGDSTVVVMADGEQIATALLPDVILKTMTEKDGKAI